MSRQRQVEKGKLPVLTTAAEAYSRFAPRIEGSLRRAKLFAASGNPYHNSTLRCYAVLDSRSPRSTLQEYAFSAVCRLDAIKSELTPSRVIS
jgi:hypothetical protein